MMATPNSDRASGRRQSVPYTMGVSEPSRPFVGNFVANFVVNLVGQRPGRQILRQSFRQSWRTRPGAPNKRPVCSSRVRNEVSRERALPAPILGSGLLWALLLCWAAVDRPTAVGALPTSAPPAEIASNRVHRLYVETRHRWQEQTNGAEAAWGFARACFDRADFATNDLERAALAEQGIAASRRAIQLQTNSAAAYYYLGLNLGQLAQTKLLGAIKLIEQMEAAWKQAIELDEKFDYAGPHRSLGLLY